MEEISEMDMAGSLMVNEVNVGDRVRVFIEGEKITGSVDSVDSSNSYDKEVVLECEKGRELVLLTDNISSEDDIDDHYKIDAYEVNQKTRSIDWVGLVTEVNILE